MVLLLGVVAMITLLARGYSHTLRVTEKKDRTLHLARSALELARTDLEAAVELIVPTGSAVSSTLVLRKIDPVQEKAVPRLADPLAPGPWDPADPVWTTTVTYAVTAAGLERTVGGVASVVAPGTRGFSARLRGRRLVQLELASEEENRVRILRADVALP